VFSLVTHSQSHALNLLSPKRCATKRWLYRSFVSKPTDSVYFQWRKSGWNSGGRKCGSGRLDGGRGVGCGKGVPVPIGKGSEDGLGPFPCRKKIFFTKYEMEWFDAYWAVIFVRASPEKMLKFPPKMVSFLLHCNASNLVHKILKHDKFWRTICISVPHSKFRGTLSPVPGDLRPCLFLILLSSVILIVVVVHWMEVCKFTFLSVP